MKTVILTESAVGFYKDVNQAMGVLENYFPAVTLDPHHHKSPHLSLYDICEDFYGELKEIIEIEVKDLLDGGYERDLINSLIGEGYLEPFQEETSEDILSELVEKHGSLLKSVVNEPGRISEALDATSEEFKYNQEKIVQYNRLDWLFKNHDRIAEILQLENNIKNIQ